MCKRRTKEEFIEIAEFIHKDKYNYSLVKYKNSTTKIKIVCSKHGMFEQLPSNHLKYGCKKCGRIISGKKQRLSFKSFLNRANKIHNDEYDYSLVKYKNSTTKVIIICPKHGKFKQTPSSHLLGKGCKKCGIFKQTLSLKKDFDTFIEEANYIHQNKYDYSKVNYINNKTKITIICPIHGKFKQTPSGHLRGGCKDCGIINSASKRRRTNEEYIKYVNNIHNEYYNYSLTNFRNSTTKIKIICPKHGVFKQRADAHLSGQGCKKCKKNVSNISQEWLNSFDLKIEKEVPLKVNNNRYIVDGYCKETNTVYEFLGDFWHGNPKIYSFNKINPVNKKSFGELYFLTFIKLNNLKSKFNLKYIWEEEWRKINE